MTILDARTKVLIIGGGLAGLALAQILRKEKIDFEIFERDEQRSQGWSVGLDVCLGRLERLLPADIPALSTLSPNWSRDLTDTFTIVDGVTHEVVGVAGSKSLEGKDRMYFASREKMRRLLSQNIKLQTNKHFTSFKEDLGGITAIFKDGSTARGTLLVGSDGARSAVRDQLLRTNCTLDGHFLSIHGNVVLPSTLYEEILEHSTCGVLLTGTGFKSYFVLTEFLSEGQALFNWQIAYHSSDYAKESLWLQSASPQQLLEKAKTFTHDLPPYFVRAVDQTLVEDMQCPPIRILETLLPDHLLPRGNVTLMGDAAHSMLPFRGMGANTALLDTCDLAEAIIEGVRNQQSVDAVLSTYEKIMIPRGRDHVTMSHNVGEGFDAVALAGGRLDPANNGL